MEFKTLIVKDLNHGLEITLNRLEKRNSINAEMLSELHAILHLAEKTPHWTIIILRGQCGIFCMGMDFKAVSEGENTFAHDYMSLLKRLAKVPKIIISVVEGRVMAGGVGLVAASDLVISTPTSEFSLSELLWGLLPANVLPYLIRRVGFQKAYKMSLTSQVVSAEEAHQMNLVDYLTSDPEKILLELVPNLLRVKEITLRDFKNYFRKMWLINEEMETAAMQELQRLVKEPHVKHNMQRFLETGKFPWQEDE